MYHRHSFAMAALAVLVLTIEAGQVPFAALGLTVTWGAYAYFKKMLPIGPNQGFALEVILLLPFALGQMMQRWFKPWVDGHKSLATWMDRVSIAIAVYVAFSGAVVAGIWSIVRGDELAWLAVALSIMLVIGFGGAWALGGIMKLPRGDRITMLFSGGQKSIAIGAPLAATIFPPAIAGMVLLPTLIYHIAQLILSAPLATHLAEDIEPQP